MASKRKAPSLRKLQTARHLKISGLFGIQYFVVGQEIAIEIVCSSVISHLCMKSSPPLVIAFVGSPGHGKTQLALQMGELLSADIIVINCTEIRYATELLGPEAPLNKHLAYAHGERTVVFLDEFDKTTEEVRQSLLILFDQGTPCRSFSYCLFVEFIFYLGIYKDRRDTSQEYDCSNTIWILATNLGEQIIQEFCQNSRCLNGELSSLHVDDLSSKIRSTFLQTFKSKWSPASSNAIINRSQRVSIVQTTNMNCLLVSGSFYRTPQYYCAFSKFQCCGTSDDGA